MSISPGARAPESSSRPLLPARRQRVLALVVLAAVALVDQLAKAWAWRHLPGAQTNTGATWFLGGAVSRLYAAGLPGAVLDLVGAQLVALAAFAVLRRPRPRAVLLSGMLMVSGWASNLLDRLGLHQVTAPGTPRAAIDFIPLARCSYNLADACIAAGTLLLLVSGGRAYRSRLPRGVAPAPPTRPWRQLRRWSLLAAFVPLLLGTAVSLTTPGGRPPSAPVVWSPAP